MNFAGATPAAIPRFGSECQWDDVTQLPLGLSSRTRNTRYTAQSAGTRFGLGTKLQITPASSITGIGILRFLSSEPGTLDLTALEKILVAAYSSSDGNIFTAIPYLQVSKTLLTNAAFYANTGRAPLPNLWPVCTQAFNFLIVSMADCVLPAGRALIYNQPDAVLYEVSDLPVGAPWTPGTAYRAGQIVCPSMFETFGFTDGRGSWVPNPTGFLYQCVTPGVSGGSGAQPAWTTGYGNRIVDNTVQWEECTPIIAAGLPDGPAPTVAAVATTPDPASPILPNAWVYLACTLVNTVGEGINELVNVQGTIDPARVLAWQNLTGAPVDLNLVLAQIPLPWAGRYGASPLPVQYRASGINLYVYISQDDPADPAKIVDPSYYSLWNRAPLGEGALVTINGYPQGQQLPTVNTALLTDAVGNVDTGVRYMVPFFETKTIYQTGFSNGAVIRINVTQSGQGLTILRMPVGPYSMQARCMGFTVAGQSTAGPFTYISQADVESPGFNQPDVPISATRISDNLTISGVWLNFTDSYLPGATDVTAYFNKIQVPPIVDCYFSKTLQRMIYTGAVGYPSGHLISDLQDPETVRVPGSNLQVAETDGDRTITWREVRGVQISLKENAGFAILDNGGDPSNLGSA